MKHYSLAERDTNALVFSQVCAKARRGELLAALTGRSRRLLALDEALGACGQPASQAEAVIDRTVPIDAIRGSEGRCADFDLEFNPLGEQTRDRWLGIAAARQRGRVLPPVDLVQVGGVYFVRDGHHRISVARAFGQKQIQARVAVLPVQGPLPWARKAKPASRRGPAALQEGLAATYGTP